MQSRFKKILWAILPRYFRRIVEDRINSHLRLSQQEWAAPKIASWWIRQQYGNLVDASRLPRQRLQDSEFKVYSQNGEDGILAFVFSQIGVTDHSFVEFGIGNGSECNTANFILNFGWHGMLMESNLSDVSAAQRYYRERLGERAENVRIIHAVVTAENVNRILHDNAVVGEIDLLSIDIDSNDYWVWKAVSVISPRVVVIEYNAALGIERSVTVKYAPDFDFSHFTENYFGASLAALDALARSKGYALIGCDSRGVNAFFVRNDLAAGKFDAVSVVEAYRPHWIIMANDLDPEKYFARINHLGFDQV